ncbi:hypothetical protein [Methylococcus mesophilus]|uniref:hypothetical protein n=1 Tax=Methylococcus mesophilus TaxID=2993564 RepID=UPI00224AD8D5|nr:hypothetical protein [Methylococcus mesophilus]UZR28339.1 hypothetical protein OOT43_16705 [Methylococcus mesophilus]
METVQGVYSGGITYSRAEKTSPANRPAGRSYASQENPEPTKNKAIFVLDHKTNEATIEATAPLLCTRSSELDRFRTGAAGGVQKKPGPKTSPETPSQRIKLEENIGCNISSPLP